MILGTSDAPVRQTLILAHAVVRTNGHTLESQAKVVLDLNEKIRVSHVDDDSSFLKVACAL